MITTKDPLPTFLPESAKLLRFRYRNWRGKEYEYVIEPEKIEFGPYDAGGGTPRPLDQCNWVLHGMVVTRDGDVRPEMWPTRRRTFLLTEIKQAEEIERSR